MAAPQQFIAAGPQAATMPAPVYAAPTGPVAWNSGICGCFNDCGSCCLGYWCPCILYGKNNERLRGGGCCGPCCIYTCVCVFFWPALACVTMGTRGELRRKYNIEETPCGDCCTKCWCETCSNCQEARELTYRGL